MLMNKKGIRKNLDSYERQFFSGKGINLYSIYKKIMDTSEMVEWQCIKYKADIENDIQYVALATVLEFTAVFFRKDQYMQGFVDECVDEFCKAVDCIREAENKQLMKKINSVILGDFGVL